MELNLEVSIRIIRLSRVHRTESSSLNRQFGIARYLTACGERDAKCEMPQLPSQADYIDSDSLL